MISRIVLKFMLLFVRIEHGAGCSCGCPNHSVVVPTTFLKLVAFAAVLTAVATWRH